MLLPTSLSKLQMASPPRDPTTTTTTLNPVHDSLLFHKTWKNELKWNQIEISGAVFSGRVFVSVVIFKAAILI